MTSLVGASDVRAQRGGALAVVGLFYSRMSVDCAGINRLIYIDNT